MSCGIYKIENKINHHVYIGQSVNIERRWNKHKNFDDNCVIHQAFKKWGIENFEFSILEECKIEELDEREKYWIKYYNSYEEGYNSTLGGKESVGISISLTYEQVKEIRKLLKDTKESNIEISKKFNVSENMIIGINTGYYWREEEIDYPIRKYQKVEFFCQNCGIKLKTKSAILCPKCSSLTRRKVQRPNKEELEKLLKENNGNFTYVAKGFSVSDNTIRKWCKAYDLPYHSSDYKVKNRI